MRLLKWLNVGLRGVMEIGIILALAYWGYHLSSNTLIQSVLCIIIPVLVFGFWGWFDFRGWGRYAEVLRLIQEMIISLAAAYALYVLGRTVSGFTLAGISVVHHILVYILGEKLLK